jgi:hypothetical protein
MVFLFMSLFACGDKVSDSAESGVEVNNSNCPNEVPEDLRYTWDCQNVDCGGSTVYRLGSGASIADGTISMTEQWFVFDGIQPCIDTFEISGIESDTNPDVFGCSGCERIFEVTWTLTDMQCNWNWSSTFADQESEDQIYIGYLLLDTHHRVSFDEDVPFERYEDNLVVISAAPVNMAEGVYASIADYGNGIATPSGEDGIGVPEEYSYASNGSCYQ